MNVGRTTERGFTINPLADKRIGFDILRERKDQEHVKNKQDRIITGTKEKVVDALYPTKK